MKKYYIYAWYDTSDENVFYVGKGSGDRKKYWKHRNELFKDYYNSHNCDVKLLEENIEDEDEAYGREIYWITYYKSRGQCKTNLTFGGKLPPTLYGEDNGMWGKTHTDSVKEYLRKINSDGRVAGKNNPQYGISPKDRMDEKTYDNWRRKHSESMLGENNPQYGVSPYDRIPKEKIEQWKKNLSKSCSGELNGNHKPIIMYNDSFKKEFLMIKSCAEFLIDNQYSKSSVSSISSSISAALHQKTKYLGFYYKFN